jgi:carboxymethylenebutenolidase
VAVLPHEGTYSVMYVPLAVSVGAGYRRGYLARPDQAGKFPTVILTPDLDGLGAHEKHVARRLARHGVAVLVVDLYPTAPSDRREALSAYHAISDSEAMRTIDETYDYLRSDDIDWAHTERLGLLGLDVGGRFSLISAARRNWVGAAGVVSTPLTGDEDRTFPVADILRHIPVPVLGLYGKADELVDTETVDEAQNRNSTGQWLLYEDAQHSFLDEVGDEYHEASAEDALARLADFFITHLPAISEINLG